MMQSHQQFSRRWAELGCVLIKLPDGTGVVCSPQTARMCTLNHSGWAVVDFLLNLQKKSDSQDIKLPAAVSVAIEKFVVDLFSKISN
jgi:hypothetical protein